MSSSSYAAWAKFDVEAELERVDEVERRADQHKHQLKQVQAKESVESSATQAAQQSADILAAQAAVAALKAKKRVRKGRSDGTTEVVTEATEKAAKLQAQAALFAQKHELLQQIMENRRLGDKALANEKGEAKHLFKKALAAIIKLEKLAPELLIAEEEQVKSVKKELEPSNQQDNPHDGECSHGSEHGDSCGKGCSHGEKKVKTKTAQALPKANDLVAIIKMFYKDVYMGIGTCELGGNSLAAASDAFKEVLLRDDVNLAAWLKRGKTFERMNAPLLALLHYNRVTTLDPDNETGKESLERVKIKLLTEGDAISDSNTVKSVVSELTGGQTFRTVLERIRWIFEEANVLATESFFAYSTTKYQVVLGCLEALRTQPECRNENAVSPVLREIEISCHVNIASGCLEMQRNYTSGLTHCEQAMHLDSSRAMPHFRMGQLYHALHKYDNALRCFETAKSLVPRSLEDQQKKMLGTIAKEVDKCAFDRNQYDTGYLRSLTAKQD